MPSIARDRVEAGAKYLDSRSLIPDDWRSVVNPSTLRLQDQDVLTQVGSYAGLGSTASEVFIRLGLSVGDQERYGFRSSPALSRDVLADAWRVYLAIASYPGDFTSGGDFTPGAIWYSIPGRHPTKVTIGGTFTTAEHAYVSFNARPDVEENADNFLTRTMAYFTEHYTQRPPLVPGALYYSATANAHYLYRNATTLAARIRWDTEDPIAIDRIPTDAKRVRGPGATGFLLEMRVVTVSDDA